MKTPKWVPSDTEPKTLAVLREGLTKEAPIREALVRGLGVADDEEDGEGRTARAATGPAPPPGEP